MQIRSVLWTAVSATSRKVVYICAQVMQLDIEKFRQEVVAYETAVDHLAVLQSEDARRQYLKEWVDKAGIALPWEGSFDTFMRQKKEVLVFE